MEAAGAGHRAVTARDEHLLMTRADRTVKLSAAASRGRCPGERSAGAGGCGAPGAVSVEIIDVAPGLWVWRQDHPDWHPDAGWDPPVTSTCVESEMMTI